MAGLGAWVEVPTTGSVFAATRAGLVEITNTGDFVRHSGSSLSAIALDYRTGGLGVAGTQIGRWTPGAGFVPWPIIGDPPPVPGSPVDLAIDKKGQWWFLYPKGHIRLVSGSGDYLATASPEDGIPRTAMRIWAALNGDDVLVGSTADGMVAVAWRNP